MEVQFNIPAVPVPEPRKRVRVTKSKAGKVFAQHYTPKSDPVNAFKDTARIAARFALKRISPLEGPLKLHLVFVMPRTQNQFFLKKAMPRIWHSKKPDFDNLEKAICDALNGVVWIDDAQICVTETIKVIAAGNEHPHVEVRCTQIQGEYPSGGQKVLPATSGEA